MSGIDHTAPTDRWQMFHSLEQRPLLQALQQRAPPTNRQKRDFTDILKLPYSYYKISNVGIKSATQRVKVVTSVACAQTFERHSLK